MKYLLASIASLTLIVSGSTQAGGLFCHSGDCDPGPTCAAPVVVPTCAAPVVVPTCASPAVPACCGPGLSGVAPVGVYPGPHGAGGRGGFTGYEGLPNMDGGGLHGRYPYHSYRRPWAHPGPMSTNINIVW